MIDPEAEIVRAQFNAGPPLDEVGLATARRWLAEQRAQNRAKTPVARVQDWMAGAIPVRLYHPQPSETLPVVLYAHGGGWILGSIDTADEACRRLAIASGCAVVSVEYRLAPEAHHPAPVDDLLDVLDWIPNTTDALRIDARRVAIAGESSGAHVALAVALEAHRSVVRPLAAQLLVCPAVDRRLSTKSWAAYGDHYVPRRSQMKWMWDLYLGERDEYRVGAPDPQTANLAGLPPTVLVVAEYDPLRDEALELAQRLRDAQCAVEVIDCAGQIHPVFAHAPAVSACDRYLKRAAEHIGALLKEDRDGQR